MSSKRKDTTVCFLEESMNIGTAGFLGYSGVLLAEYLSGNDRFMILPASYISLGLTSVLANCVYQITHLEHNRAMRFGLVRSMVDSVIKTSPFLLGIALALHNQQGIMNQWAHFNLLPAVIGHVFACGAITLGTLSSIED